MGERSISLYCKDGSSDKVYQVHLRARDGAWAVDFANGRRGGALRTGTKTAAPVSLEAAQAEFDRIVVDKKKGGYTESEDGQAYTSSEYAGRASGVELQLSVHIDDVDLEEMLSDPAWGTQEKANGERRAVVYADGVLRGVNKKRLYVDVPATWAPNPAAGHGSFVVDGEQVGERLQVFDLLEVNGENLRALPFKIRFSRLQEFVDRQGPGFMTLLSCNMSEQSKRSHLDWVKQVNREGIVFKRLDAPYEGGRGDAAMKYKLVESSTCVVLAHNRQRSVQIGMREQAGGTMVPLGNVTIPSNHAIPSVGALVEVEYLYYNPGGALEQPVYLGERTDVLEEEVVIAQIKRLKPEEGEVEFEREREGACGA